MAEQKKVVEVFDEDGRVSFVYTPPTQEEQERARRELEELIKDW